MDPAVRKWLDSSGGQKFLSVSEDELTVLTIAATHPDVGSLPEDVLISWHRSLASARTTWRQAEVAFIRAALDAGWADDRVREVLGLPDDTSPDDHLTDLESQIAAQHPSHNPAPWTGGRWTRPQPE